MTAPVSPLLPVPLIVGGGVLLAAVYQAVQSWPGPSLWTPVGLLVGVALMGVAVRAQPVPAQPPRATVAVTGTALAVLAAYAFLVYGRWVEAADVPGYLGSIALPLLAAAAAGTLAVLAARRHCLLACAGAILFAWAGLKLADLAGLEWAVTGWDTDPSVLYGAQIIDEHTTVVATRNEAGPLLVQDLGPIGPAVAIVLGVALVLGSILRRSTRPT
jgi:hypothetical protein